MPGTNKLRGHDHRHYRARYIACSEVVAAVGLPVLAEFQEIEGNDVIIELQIGDETIHTPQPSRLAAAVDKAVADLEVLSSWKEPTLPRTHSSALPGSYWRGRRNLASSRPACL